MKILIQYGSFTGNTQMTAEAMHASLADDLPGHEIDLKNVRDVAPADLPGYDLIIFGASTWDHGQADPDTEEFLAGLAAAAPDLSGKTFALFGLGESSYPDFCDAIPVIKKALEPLRAIVLPDTFTIDGYPEEPMIADLISWAKKVIGHLGREI